MSGKRKFMRQDYLSQTGFDKGDFPSLLMRGECGGGRVRLGNRVQNLKGVVKKIYEPGLYLEWKGKRPWGKNETLFKREIKHGEHLSLPLAQNWAGWRDDLLKLITVAFPKGGGKVIPLGRLNGKRKPGKTCRL